jgi:hypothetical protein
MLSSETHASAEFRQNVETIAAQVEALVNGDDSITVDDLTIQRLMTAAALLYVARVETGGDLPATTPAALNATSGMIVTTGLLRAVNVQLFELGLWQSWAH